MALAVASPAGAQAATAGPSGGRHRRATNKVLETGENVDAGNPHNGGALCQ